MGLIYGNPTGISLRILLYPMFLTVIYLEQSNENILHNNKIERFPLWYALMFSNDNVLSENVSRSNVTGTMLMESKRPR